MEIRLLVLVGVLGVGCYQSGPSDDGDDPIPPSQNGGGSGGGGGGSGGGGGGGCVDECVPGSSECVAGGVQACTRIDGCARRSPVQSCGAGSVCEDGICRVQNATKPDLYFGPGTECWLDGGDVSCTVNICNGGSVTSSATTLKFFLDAPGVTPQCADPSLPSEVHLALAPITPGNCTNETWIFYEQPSPGSHQIAMFIDGSCAADEANEADNYSIFSPDLVVSAPANPELWFDSTSELYWNTAGDSVYAMVRVCNFGSGAAGQFYIDFWANGLYPLCGDDGDDYLSIAGLAAGACTSWWTTRQVYVGTSYYEKTARLFIDSACTVAEPNEVTNVWTVTYY
jgi:hypothetical protein